MMEIMRFIELLFFVSFGLFFVTQVALPLWSGRPSFPLFRGKERELKAKLRELELQLREEQLRRQIEEKQRKVDEEWMKRINAVSEDGVIQNKNNQPQKGREKI